MRSVGHRYLDSLVVTSHNGKDRAAFSLFAPLMAYDLPSLGSRDEEVNNLGTTEFLLFEVLQVSVEDSQRPSSLHAITQDTGLEPEGVTLELFALQNLAPDVNYIFPVDFDAGLCLRCYLRVFFLTEGSGIGGFSNERDESFSLCAYLWGEYVS